MPNPEKPTQLPPGQSGTGGNAGSSRPTPLSTEQQAKARRTPSSAPTAMPPAHLAVRTEGVIGAWNNDKQVTALWSLAENRNSWMHVDGVGWKKLADNSDSVVVALTMLAAHARELNRTVNYRDEADGKVYELYVW